VTQQEAKEFLRKNWWRSVSSTKPEDCWLVVGDLYEENEHDYGFNAYPCKINETPPEDLEDWDVWYVSKNGDGCGVHLF
jgi:hypothetical protein